MNHNFYSQEISINKWYKVALFNLVILALLGLTLRFKINFPLPFFEQQNLLNAHSNFAFNGWVGFLLQVLLVDEFTQDYKQSHKFWNRLFLADTVVNYLMIIGFAWLGYTTIPIIISLLALWLSYAFAYKLYKALPVNENKSISIRFVKGALLFLVLSSVGPYSLIALIVSNVGNTYWTHNAMYAFLHFQYNGWFTFAVLALLFKKLEASATYNYKHAKTFFILLAITLIPSYLFTSLWHHRPLSITIIIVITAILQTAALYFLWHLLSDNMKSVYSTRPVICRWLYSLAISAYILKVLLQFFSVEPELAKLAFGYRPIIIGYLHLIFLVFISLYLLAFITDKKILSLSHGITSIGLIIFAAGVIINELLLAIQGFAAIYYLFLPQLNVQLFANTFVIFGGALLLYQAAQKSAIR